MDTGCLHPILHSVLANTVHLDQWKDVTINIQLRKHQNARLVTSANNTQQPA